MLFRFSVIEHDQARPWLIRSTRTGLSLEAENAYDFREKVEQEWPADRFVVELAPGELMRALKAG